MATSRPSGPVPVDSPNTSIPPSLDNQIDLLISLHLHAWPALTLAIQNAWGGSPQVSNDKRDWLAGAVSELISTSPSQLQDVSDLEEVLLQVMVDEFEVVVDDGSAEETARKIWTGVGKLKQGEVGELEEMQGKWIEKQAKGGSRVQAVRGTDVEGEETDWDDEDEEDEDDEEDEFNRFDEEDEFNRFDDRMHVDPPTALKTKIEAEVDEDGFTKVLGKKKR